MVATIYVLGLILTIGGLFWASYWYLNLKSINPERKLLDLMGRKTESYDEPELMHEENDDEDYRKAA